MEDKNMKKTDFEIRKDYIRYFGYETISDFASAVNEDVSNVWKVLNGKQKPTIEKMIKYAIVLKVDISDIITLFYPESMKKYNRMKTKRRKMK